MHNRRRAHGGQSSWPVTGPHGSERFSLDLGGSQLGEICMLLGESGRFWTLVSRTAGQRYRYTYTHLGLPVKARRLQRAAHWIITYMPDAISGSSGIRKHVPDIN